MTVHTFQTKTGSVSIEISAPGTINSLLAALIQSLPGCHPDAIADAVFAHHPEWYCRPQHMGRTEAWRAGQRYSYARNQYNSHYGIKGMTYGSTGSKAPLIAVVQTPEVPSADDYEAGKPDTNVVDLKAA